MSRSRQAAIMTAANAQMFGLILGTLGRQGSTNVLQVLFFLLFALSTLNEINCHEYTHTHPFNGPSPGTTQVSWYQKVKTNLDFTEARDSEWQWHPLGNMQVCTTLQSDNHASTPPLSFSQVGCPSCCPTNSVKALKANKLP